MAYSFKGFLSFGFVYIPVNLHLAIKENNFSFRLFDKKTLSKIQYKKTCIECNNKEVKNEDIIKGYEYADGKYVMLEDKDFEKIKTPKDRNITIEQFVDLDEINSLYFGKTYYLVPTGAEKAYNLLLKAMQEENKAGLGKTVLGIKETLVLIRPYEDKMCLSTLYFQEEIKACPKIDNVTKVTSQELKLAKTLIKEMTKPFKPEKFHDEYAARVEKMIQDKIKGKKIITPKAKKESHISDLMEALENSLEQYSFKPKKKTKKAPLAKNKKSNSSLHLS